MVWLLKPLLISVAIVSLAWICRRELTDEKFMEGFLINMALFSAAGLSVGFVWLLYAM